MRVWKRNASEMIPSDQIKVMSVSEGKCMSGVTGDLSLVDCNSNDAWINLYEQYSGTFRLNIAGKVLEIANSSKDDGAKAGIWNWNGGGHQQFAFEKQPEYDSNVVTMMARHSGKFLQADSQGNVFQAPLPENKTSALWRIFQPGETITSAEDVVSSGPVHFIDNKLIWSGEGSRDVNIEVYDSRGVCCLTETIGSNNAEVGMEKLPEGVYVVIMNGNQAMKVMKR